MKFEYGLTIILCIFVFFTLVLITLNPNETPYWRSLNNISIILEAYSDDPNIFQKTSQSKDSTCFTTPNENLFCYQKPRMYEDFGVSYVSGENGVQGELHFDPVSKGVTYFTIKNMSKLDDDTARITFADQDYKFGNRTDTTYSIEEKFEFSTIIKKFDSFISHCQNYDGSVVSIVQYIGISTIDDMEYFMTWHTPANSEPSISCNYPEIIQHSLKHNFEEL